MPISLLTSRHSGTGSCQHCFSTTDREQAAFVQMDASISRSSWPGCQDSDLQFAVAQL